MFAVIKTGGKQYRVASGQKLKIDKIDGEMGDKFVFNEVLLKADGEKVDLGMPYLEGAQVEAKIVKQDRYDKIIVFRYKSKTRRRTKKGHRQHFTEVEITGIQ